MKTHCGCDIIPSGVKPGASVAVMDMPKNSYVMSDKLTEDLIERQRLQQILEAIRCIWIYMYSIFLKGIGWFHVVEFYEDIGEPLLRAIIIPASEGWENRKIDRIFQS